MRRALLASLSLLLAAPAFAQPISPIPPRRQRAPKTTTPKATPAVATHGNSYLPAPDVQPATTHKEGDYGGVTPGETPTNHPLPRHKPPAGTLSWLGFEAKDGGAELFFQSIAPFDLTQSVEGNALVVHLGNLHALGANAGRMVDTRFFDNPLARVEAKHAARGLEVRVTFKNAKDTQPGQYKSAQEADGYYYAYLSFPAGGGAAPATTAEPEK